MDLSQFALGEDMLTISDLLDSSQGIQQPQPEQPRKPIFSAKLPELNENTFPDFEAPKMRLSIPDEARIDNIKKSQVQKKQEPRDPNRRLRRGEETTLF